MLFLYETCYALSDIDNALPSTIPKNKHFSTLLFLIEFRERCPSFRNFAVSMQRNLFDPESWSFAWIIQPQMPEKIMGRIWKTKRQQTYGRSYFDTNFLFGLSNGFSRTYISNSEEKTIWGRVNILAGIFDVSGDIFVSVCTDTPTAPVP